MYFLVNLNHHPLKQSFDGKCSNYTLCPRSLDPVHLVTYNIKWIRTSWTDGKASMCRENANISRHQ